MRGFYKMEKITYQISSRAAILLGRESVSKVDGAIIELVKNTYDADASLCILTFDVEHDAIYIIDNGTGMTKDIIQNCWMLIGTDNKKYEYQSKKHRIKSGEKGIGRFALDRLGEVCEMYTKHIASPKTLYWKTDWKNFEEVGKKINEVAADLDYLNEDIKHFIPKDIAKALNDIDKSLINDFHTGTIIKITHLRDNWTNNTIMKIIDMLSYVIPSTGIQDYSVYTQTSLSNKLILVENEIINEFDYKLLADFDGENFHIQLFRNEFDIPKISEDIFIYPDFQKFPYKKEDFINGHFALDYSIEELNNTADSKFINTIKNIGAFKFEYIFLKANLTEDTKENYYYKTTSNHRKKWLNQNAGIKIYRDNFIIRPYGDANSDSFDWLSLDARKARSPAAPSHPTGSWRVRNTQGYGNVKISRIYNSNILDKSSREGIIDNEYFSAFKTVLVNIINVFEKDRQYIIRTFKKYNDQKNEDTRKKNDGRNLAKKIMTSSTSKEESLFSKILPTKDSHSEKSQLAEALLLIDQEKEDLLTEIKLLRALATNGLITTSIVHDLSGLSAELKGRADKFRYVIEKKHTNLINQYLENLKRNDSFLTSWISVVITQLKQDKRKRNIADLYLLIKKIEATLNPLLNQKNIHLCIRGEEGTAIKKIFSIDIESIICNLIINSIEAFKKVEQKDRNITISILSEQDYIKIIYKDNGPGISKIYKDPYDIFNFGVTDKRDKNTGEIIGTGLGMYIVASIINEYNGKYNIINNTSGFELELLIPNERS